MSEKPLISIITCFLNEEQFLAEAVESVLQQDYTHWELLLIDDGSTDKSPSIAKEFAQKYPDRIFYYDHEGHANKGLSASRNLAIKESSGDLIAFLDGDDVWLSGILSQLLNIMQQHPVAMVCEGSEYWYNWDGAEKDNEYISIGTKENKIYYPPQLLLNLYPLGKGAAPCLCGILVKKDKLLKNGGFDESFTGMYEDQVLLSKFYLNEIVYISSECNNRYRQKQGSLVKTSRIMGRYLDDRKYFLEWLEQYLNNIDFKNKQVKNLLNIAFLPYHHPWLNFVRNTIPHKAKRLLYKLSSKQL